MKNHRKRNLLIALGAAAGIGVLCFIFFWLLPTIFQKWISEEAIEAFLAGSSGARGLLLLALFQAGQVVSIFIPGAAVQIAGGLVFGALKSFLVCHLAFVGTNVAVFALARLRRESAAKPNAKRGRKTQKVLDWINSSDPSFMTMLAYMMPGIPNGFVPYAVVRTNVTLRQFFLATYLGSLIQIAIMCAVGSRIMSGDFAVSFFLVLGSLALIFVLYLTKSRLVGYIQRRRQTRDTAVRRGG
jgi:uncharacterized membrane protein YdjX (TVP38/TMEM64 family)